MEFCILVYDIIVIFRRICPSPAAIFIEYFYFLCYTDNTNSMTPYEGGDIMYKPRDYSKPMTIKFKGVQGLKAYIKLLKTPPIKYDAKSPFG